MTEKTEHYEIVKCKKCLKEFKAFKSQLARGYKKYCSRKCRMTRIAKNCLICEKEFYTTPMRVSQKRGRFCSQKCVKEWMSINIRGEKSHSWKGNEVGYRTIHEWVISILGQPTKCSDCVKENLFGKNIHWANKDHAYRRVISDWMRLCSKCHGEYDKKNHLRVHKYGKI